MSKTPVLAILFLAACAGTQSPPSTGPNPDQGGISLPSTPPSSSSDPAGGLPARPPLGEPPPGGACTEMGCSSGLSLSLEPGARWPAGDYRFEIEADGAAQVCTVTLPLKACSAGSSVSCTGASLATLGESGCALGAKEHGLSAIHFQGTPRTGKVTIARQGQVLVTEDLAPAYRWVQPNGRGCEPQCLQASSTIRVPL